jgi:phosphohistidine swiveling domain-containing protein
METSVLTGLAASPGTHVGQAIVAKLPSGALEGPGGVLVLAASSLDWLEAITRAGAVVTEVGGKTSHAATICRELGKPCVTGVANATSLIRTGVWVAVDGGAGTVSILP